MCNILQQSTVHVNLAYRFSAFHEESLVQEYIFMNASDHILEKFHQSQAVANQGEAFLKPIYSQLDGS